MATYFTYNPPAASTGSTFTFDTPSTPAPYAFNTRKRSREGAAYQRGALGNSIFRQPSDWSNLSKASSIARSDDAASPAPLVDTRYLFANGVPTPAGEDDVGERYDRGDQSIYAQYRRRWSVPGEEQDPTPGLCVTNQTGNPSPDPDICIQRSPGWGKFVFNIVGGVAGKMWDFCRGAAFQGFYAGGGQGYVMKAADQQDNMQMAESIWEDLDNRHPLNMTDRSPIPGQFPEETSSYNFPQNENARPRPPKRLHTDTGAGWVYVSHDLDKSTSRAPSPALSSNRYTNIPASPSQIPRPSVHIRPSPSAGRRRSLIPVTRRTSGVSITGSPAPRQSLPSVTVRSASRGSPNSLRQRQYTSQSYDAPALLSPAKKGSPISPEVRRYAARLRREELAADASMNRLSAQLNALIKQGKEALHSKIEVEYEDDEGFSEGR